MKNIVLVGFMGTGKTTTGRLLAGRLARSFIDVDRQLEAICGMVVSDIFKHHGEAFFREQERLAIRECLPHHDAIVATGGGAVLSPENITNLKKHGILICLTAAVDAIIRRIGTDATRPLLNAPNKEELVASMMRERAERYRLADYVIDTTLLNPEEAATTIIELVRRHERECSVGCVL